MMHLVVGASWRHLAASLCAAGACTAAGAQVHRCGDAPVYTDKPCAGARAVDLQANIMDAGPRFIPSYEPAPAVIPPSAYERKKETASDDIWQRRSARDSRHRARTGPYGAQ